MASPPLHTPTRLEQVLAQGAQADALRQAFASGGLGTARSNPSLQGLQGIGPGPAQPGAQPIEFSQAGASQAANVAAQQRALQGAQGAQPSALQSVAGLAKTLKSVPGLQEGISGLFAAGPGAGAGGFGAGAAAAAGSSAPALASGAGFGAGPAAGAFGGAPVAGGLGAGVGVTAASALAAPLLGTLGFKTAFQGLKKLGIRGDTPNPQVVRLGSTDGEFGRTTPRISEGSAQDEIAGVFQDFAGRAITASGLDPNEMKGELILDGGQFVIHDDEGEEIGRFDDMVQGIEGWVRQNTGNQLDFSGLKAPDLDFLENQASQRAAQAIRDQTSGNPGGEISGELLRELQRPTLLGTTR